MQNEELKFVDIGKCPYELALIFQEQIQKSVSEGSCPDLVVFVEHPSVLTLGKNSVDGHLLSNESELSDAGIEIHKTDRGGQVTAHEEGQLVMYPILSITKLNLTFFNTL